MRADSLLDLLEETVARLHAETTIDTTKAEVAVILDLGTKTRQWNAAQRRAIRYRFGGRCFVPGCDRRIVELHHTNPIGEGGATDLDLALPVCKGHHHLVHEGGWTASYDRITGVATLTGPDGQNISCPPYRQSPVISPRRNPSRVETSAGSSCSSFHRIRMGRSPVWPTYEAGPAGTGVRCRPRRWTTGSTPFL